MTALKAGEVARYVARPDRRDGVFLIYGPDGGLVRETGEALSAALAAGTEPAEVRALEASEVDAEPDRLAIEAKTSSLFGGRQVVRLRGMPRGLATMLAPFVDDPDGAAIVVEAGNLTPRDPVRALVEGSRNARALPCYADSDETVRALIADSFAKAGIAADREVATTLQSLLGNDRAITKREIDKLILYAGDGGALTAADVLVLCADNAMLAVDDILDATAGGHAEALDTALSRALAAGTNVQQALSMALLHFAALRRWRAEVDGGRSIRDVLDSARPRPHFSRRAGLEQQLRLWSDPALGHATARLNAAVAQSRRRPALAEAVTRRTLLALSRMAAEH